MVKPPTPKSISGPFPVRVVKNQIHTRGEKNKDRNWSPEPDSLFKILIKPVCRKYISGVIKPNEITL